MTWWLVIYRDVLPVHRQSLSWSQTRDRRWSSTLTTRLSRHLMYTQESMHLHCVASKLQINARISDKHILTGTKQYYHELLEEIHHRARLGTGSFHLSKDGIIRRGWIYGTHQNRQSHSRFTSSIQNSSPVMVKYRYRRFSLFSIIQNSRTHHHFFLISFISKGLIYWQLHDDHTFL